LLRGFLRSTLGNDVEGGRIGNAWWLDKVRSPEDLEGEVLEVDSVGCVGAESGSSGLEDGCCGNGPRTAYVTTKPNGSMRLKKYSIEMVF